VAYQEVDVSVDAAGRSEMLAKSGQMGVPVIDVGGTVVIGFDKEQLEVLLAKAE
jgi:glutaredoxin 3